VETEKEVDLRKSNKHDLVAHEMLEPCEKEGIYISDLNY